MKLHNIYIAKGEPWGEDIDIDRLCEWAADYIEELEGELAKLEHQDKEKTGENCMSEKTAVIWSDYGVLEYAVADGDLRKYHLCYINKGVYDDMRKELSSLSADFDFCDFETFAKAVSNGAYIIECGYAC
jgi:hypothetical protein